MPRTIGQYAVHVNSSDGTLHSFLPGESVPEWAEKLLGDHCFSGHEDLFSEDGKPLSVKPTAEAVVKAAVEDAPPQAGPGSGREAWAAYAKKHGVEVDDEVSRHEIIEACRKAGVPV